MDDNKDIFIIECPVCKKKHGFPLMERNRSVQFACSDDFNTNGIGCKSVITISVAEFGYNDNKKNKKNEENEKCILLTYNNEGVFVGYLKCLDATGNLIFTKQKSQAYIFDSLEDCIFSDNQKWETLNLDKGYYKIEKIKDGNT